MTLIGTFSEKTNYLKTDLYFLFEDQALFWKFGSGTLTVNGAVEFLDDDQTNAQSKRLTTEGLRHIQQNQRKNCRPNRVSRIEDLLVEESDSEMSVEDEGVPDILFERGAEWSDCSDSESESEQNTLPIEKVQYRKKIEVEKIQPIVIQKEIVKSEVEKSEENESGGLIDEDYEDDFEGLM